MTDYYNIYRGRDGDIDYDTPVATMDLSDTQVQITSQALPAGSIWHYVRRRVRGHGCGLESDDSPACVIYIDGAGEMEVAAPNPPVNLIAEPAADGKILLRWRYSAAGQECSPDGFAIFQSTDGNYSDTPTALVVGGMAPNGEFQWLSDALTAGTLYRFVLKSFSNTTGGISLPTQEVIAVPDDTGPAAIENLIAEINQ